MRYSLQWIRSLIFNINMYLAMPVLGVIFFPYALASREGAVTACKTYCRWVRWTASWMIGLKTEIRGEIPTGEVLIAAKHQSFFDVIVLYGTIPRAKFIMKSLLIYAPVIGLYALRIGCIPVNRGKRGAAIEKMLRDVESGAADPGQLVIYPQGTRVAPGAFKPYKIGTFVLYEQLKQACVPVALNVGVFWPRRGVYRSPGTVVMEFLDPIEPGLEKKEFLEQLESMIETRSNALMADAGYAAKEV
ncbi:MAG: lysophospholipid acyltransferase family protein [Pseudomonadota bacterium]